MSTAAKISWQELPLRERKAAETRVGLFEAARDRMEVEPYASIPVRSLCQQVGVTEPTFFKYFPEKADLLVYGIMLWGVHMGWRLAQLRERTPLERIEWFFAESARQFAERPGFTAELLARQVLRRGPKKFLEIGLAERLRAFPDCPGIERHPGMGFISLITPLLRQARKDGSLPAEPGLRTVRDALWSIFTGVAINTLWEEPHRIRLRYREQIDLLWRAVGVR